MSETQQDCEQQGPDQRRLQGLYDQSSGPMIVGSIAKRQAVGEGRGQDGIAEINRTASANPASPKPARMKGNMKALLTIMALINIAPRS